MTGLTDVLTLVFVLALLSMSIKHEIVTERMKRNQRRIMDELDIDDSVEPMTEHEIQEALRKVALHRSSGY